MVLAINGLTDKQERYAQGLFSGLNQCDAYRAAYDCSNWTPEAIKVEASRLADNPNVVLTVKKLQEAAGGDDPLIASVVTRKRQLSKIVLAEVDPKTVRPRDVTTAAHTLNLMDRLYKPDDSPTNAGQVVIINVVAPGVEVKQIVTGERFKLPDHTVS